MADSSESEEFYDAVSDHNTPTHRSNSRKRSPKIAEEIEPPSFAFPEPDIRIDEKNLIAKAKSEEPDKLASNHPQTVEIRNEHKFIEPKSTGRKRFQELRQFMQNDEDENVGNTLTPESQNSSTEGVYATNRSTHPFRIIENDAVSIQSMTSLGRVGRILSVQTNMHQSGGQQPQSLPVASTASHDSLLSKGGSGGAGSSKEDTLSQKSADKIYTRGVGGLQEPDVIASTKLAHSKTTDSLTTSRPEPPPRRKKKTRKLSTSSSVDTYPCESSKLTASGSGPASNDQLLASESAQGTPTKPTTCESLPPERPPIDNSDNISTTSSVGHTSNSSVKLPPIASEMPPPTQQQLGSMQRISHSLGNSSNSVNTSKPSPSNSMKSNSAPARASSLTGSAGGPTSDIGGGLNLVKALGGQYVVKPHDSALNKAEGPTKEEMERIERLRAEILGTNSEHRINFAGCGTNSLESGMRYSAILSKRTTMSGGGARGSAVPDEAGILSGLLRERRKSAGDEDILKQLNMYVRTRTDSGKPLTDDEILGQIPVKNLDTGENFPLSDVEEKLPQFINPLSLHIMRLTSTHLPESDEESVTGSIATQSEAPEPDDENEVEEETGRLKKKTARIKRFFASTARKTVDKAKSFASEVSHARHKEDVADIEDVVNPEQNIKIKASSSNKGPYDFTKLQHVQDLSGEHTGAVWCMKFSSCGRLLATAGQDKVLRIWVLKDAYSFFQDMRNKYNADQKSSPTPSQESLVSHHSAEDALAFAAAAEKCTGPFMPRSFCTYSGHTSDLLDVSWSKNYFVLSSSMDKTVRLWHISRKECLCCFQHIDFVTAIAFHPRDDRYFLSGSLDGKLRLWNIPDKKVALWNEVDGQTKLITAANFCQNGKFAVVGSYDGRCLFYTTDQLKYHTQIHVRSTRGRNATGRKISGIEPMPGEDKILVTSNDSRIRLYDLRDLNLSCKYKGYLNTSSQIKASFSHDGKYIISGSENQCIYIWKTHHDYAKLSSVRRDRSDFWEGIKAHNVTVTCAIFAPHPEAILKPEPEEPEVSTQHSSHSLHPDPLVEQRKKGCGYVLISADFNGCIKVYINKTKPKHSSLPYTAILD